jgi:hypothetical protein
MPMGIYTMSVKCSDNIVQVINGVEISPDSISLVNIDIGYIFQKKARIDIEDTLWRNKKVRDAGYNGVGCISGRVVDLNVNSPLAKVNVLLDVLWIGAVSDSNGNFYFKNILPGCYSASACLIAFHYGKIFNIKIKMDSISIVNFKLTSNAIPESPFPEQWETLVVSGKYK